MNQIARKSDFQRLPPEVQDAHIAVLQTCDAKRLSCRCEMNGRDFVVIVGVGLSSPKYWLDMFTA